MPYDLKASRNRIAGIAGEPASNAVSTCFATISAKARGPSIDMGGFEIWCTPRVFQGWLSGVTGSQKIVGLG